MRHPKRIYYRSEVATEGFRFYLHRWWDDEHPKQPVEPREHMLFIGLNPSYASAMRDDNTSRRFAGFAESHGFTSVAAVNLFAYRTPFPKNLLHAHTRGVDITGGADNNRTIVERARAADLVVCAWGPRGKTLGRDREVIRLLQANGVTLHVMKLTKDGHPWHPLMLKSDTVAVRWSP